jgi:hypothetical protein
VLYCFLCSEKDRKYIHTLYISLWATTKQRFYEATTKQRFHEATTKQRFHEATTKQRFYEATVVAA